MSEVKLLQEEFVGRGEVRGFLFSQRAKSEYAYIYEVKCVDGGVSYFEVFERRENKLFQQESYPGSKSFGFWAWTFPTFNRAYDKFEELNEELKQKQSESER